MKRNTNLSLPLASITVGVILVFSLSTTSFAHVGHSVQATFGDTHTCMMKDGMQMHHESIAPVNWKDEVGFGESDPASLTDHQGIPALRTVTQMASTDIGFDESDPAGLTDRQAMSAPQTVTQIASLDVGFAEMDPARDGVSDHETISGQLAQSRHVTAINQSRHDSSMKEPGKSKMSANCKC